jgi:RNA polymerase sigma-70 factor (ECF subfamily)
MNVRQFNESVDLYSDGIYRFVLKNIRDDEMARDIVQDTYEKLWRTHENVDAAKVKSYLFSTAYHTLIDKVRRESKKADWRESSFSQIGYESGYSDLNEVLHQAIDRLPEIQKMVVMLRDYEGYSYQEIGEMTGLNESQVKVYIFRARVFLKNYIGKMEVLV